ncbi:MAG: hypothetical protein ACLSVD_06540 [Eggerthellaceae bacterium]
MTANLRLDRLPRTVELARRRRARRSPTSTSACCPASPRSSEPRIGGGGGRDRRCDARRARHRRGAAAARGALGSRPPAAPRARARFPRTAPRSSGRPRRSPAARRGLNLRWAVERGWAARVLRSTGRGPAAVADALFAEAKRMEAEDDREPRHRRARSRAAAAGQPRAHALHNAGSLATGVTARRSAWYTPAEQGRSSVYADETRPVGQGARLTSWELARAAFLHARLRQTWPQASAPGEWTP